VSVQRRRGEEKGNEKGERTMGQESDRSRAANEAWHEVVFVFDWPQGERPRTYLDLLLAWQVVWPALEPDVANIRAWKFHRRWAPTQETGELLHELKLTFRSAAETYHRVREAMHLNETLMKLKEARLVTKVKFCQGMKDSKFSDQGEAFWPEQIRKAWPYYMTGVSRAWVELIGRTKKDCEGEGADANESRIEELCRLYEGIEKDVKALWRRWARQCFLHQLSQVFGYEPVAFRQDVFVSL